MRPEVSRNVSRIMQFFKLTVVAYCYRMQPVEMHVFELQGCLRKVQSAIEGFLDLFVG